MTDTRVELTWRGGQRFAGTSGDTPLLLDGDADADNAPSPMQSLAAGLAGCMAIDVVMILEKGRQPLEGLELELTGRRAEEPPRRFLGFELLFKVRGEVEPAKVERAIRLSRETYCSVWHSLREDIDFTAHFEIV